MILYEIRCAGGHQFEAWFKDSKTFDRQAKRGQVECPTCGDTEVAKAPMAPKRVASKSEKDRRARVRQRTRELMQSVREAQREVEDKFDYVGERFPDEARKIHYGESDERPIYGEASIEEAKDLAAEDIKVFRVPWKNSKDH
jgi:hypothetical protein